jgi:glutamate racemase
MNDAAIGIFDSGMGGLTVLRALMARLPNENFVYLGDTARLPYGTKSPDTVTRYAVQAAGALVRRRVKLLVIACNTASGVALPALQQAFAPLPVVDVIAPGAEAALAAAPAGPIAVIATEATVRAGAYVRAIHARAPEIAVTQQACPLFVPLAEEGLVAGEIAELVARRYLAPVLAQQPAALVLGCTHYPALKDTIANIAGGQVKLVDSAETTAADVEHRLRDAGLLRESASAPLRHFLATDAPERFERVGQIFLGQAIDPAAVELVDLQ